MIIALSMILIPALTSFTIPNDALESNEITAEAPAPEACGESDGEHCITVCCYVMYTRTTDQGGKQVCNSGETTHCSSCCMTGTCLGEN